MYNYELKMKKKNLKKESRKRKFFLSRSLKEMRAMWLGSVGIKSQRVKCTRSLLYFTIWLGLKLLSRFQHYDILLNVQWRTLSCALI